MLTIFKYQIPIGGGEVEMPEGAKILSCQEQQGTVCLWALVDSLAPTYSRTFIYIGTGHDFVALLEGRHYEFLDTVQQYGGSLVWHIFELFTPKGG